MKYEETICFQINSLIEQIEKDELTKTQVFKALQQIRLKAQKMEDGLKIRKKIMIKNGHENEYKKTKAEFYKKEGINDLLNRSEETKLRPNFEVLVKEGEKVLYQNKAHAGLFSFVERIEALDESGIINGRCQIFTFGKPLSVFYAFDQLRQSTKATMYQTANKIAQALASGLFKNKKFREELVANENH